MGRRRRRRSGGWAAPSIDRLSTAAKGISTLASPIQPAERASPVGRVRSRRRSRRRIGPGLGTRTRAAWNSVSSRHSANRMPASRRARATAASPNSRLITAAKEVSFEPGFGEDVTPRGFESIPEVRTPLRTDSRCLACGSAGKSPISPGRGFPWSARGGLDYRRQKRRPVRAGRTRSQGGHA